MKKARRIRRAHLTALILHWSTDCLYFGVLLQHLVTHLAAPSGLLVSAKGQRRVEDVVAIDPHGSGAQLGGDAVRFLNIARPDACSQSVSGVISLSDQLVGIMERNRSHDRPKNLFFDDLHALVGVHEHGGLYEVTLVAVTRAAYNRLRAFRESSFEITANPVELFLGDERAHIG